MVATGTQRLRTRSNSAFRLIYHLVLVTKFRRKSLTGEMLERLEEIIKEFLSKWECVGIEFGGEADHVHILFETHPSQDLRIDRNLTMCNQPYLLFKVFQNEVTSHLKRQIFLDFVPVFN